MGEIAKTKKVIHHIECRRCSLYWTVPLFGANFEFWDSVLRFYVLKSLKYSILNYSDAFEIFMEIFGSESIFWYLMWEFACISNIEMCTMFDGRINQRSDSAYWNLWTLCRQSHWSCLTSMRFEMICVLIFWHISPKVLQLYIIAIEAVHNHSIMWTKPHWVECHIWVG